MVTTPRNPGLAECKGPMGAVLSGSYVAVFLLEFVVFLAVGLKLPVLAPCAGLHNDDQQNEKTRNIEQPHEELPPLFACEACPNLRGRANRLQVSDCVAVPSDAQFAASWAA